MTTTYTSEDDAEELRPVYLNCRRCSVIWVVGHLPMAMGAFAKLLKAARCPKCRKRDQAYIWEPKR